MPTPDNQPEKSGPLSNADAVELTAQIAALAAAKIPLATGLRALSLDMPRGSLARAIQRLSNHLERGIPLDRAAAMPNGRLPPYLCGLLACGLRSDNLGPVLEQFLIHQRLRDDLRRRIWSALAYPTLLVIMLAAWIAFVAGVLVKDFQKIFDDFEVELPPITVSLLTLADYGPQIAIAFAVLAVLVLVLVSWCGRSRAASDLLTAMPFIGPLWRNRGVAEFSSLLGMLVDHSMPLAQAFQLTATGLDDGALAAACQKSSRLAEAGLPLSDCVARVPPFPSTLTPILAWGDRLAAPGEALASASQWFRTRCDLHSDFLTVVIPPITFLFVTVTMIYVMSGLFAPLIKLIQSLT